MRLLLTACCQAVKLVGQYLAEARRKSVLQEARCGRASRTLLDLPTSAQCHHPVVFLHIFTVEFGDE
jgi:hypothetical protein